MPNFIPAWRKDTGQILENLIPDTWIRDNINPNLTDKDPNGSFFVPSGNPNTSDLPEANPESTTTPEEV